MNPGYVYVLAFSNGDVKVGRTQNARNRLKTHRSTARRFGLTVTDSWVSPLHLEWAMNEDTLKVIATKCGGSAKSPEYFAGADYAAVVTRANGLPFTLPGEAADGRALRCLKGRAMPARECAIRVGALDAKVRELADATHTAIWNSLRSACARCGT